MSRRIVPMLLLWPVLTLACGASQLEASATVSVSGRVVDAAGHPVAGTDVLLEREPGIGETFVDLVALTGSLGLACFTHNPPAICQSHSHRAATSSSGAYSFSIRGSDTQTELGNAATMLLVARSPDGAFTVESFAIQAQTLKMPDLRFWNAHPKIRQTRSATALSWAAPGAGYYSPKSYTAAFSVGDDEIWSASGSASGAVVDSRVLEDRHGLAHATATAHSTAEGTTVDVLYNSAPVAFGGPAGAPPSRDLGCDIAVPGGPSRQLRPCWLTAPPPGQPFACGAACQARSVTLDLGGPRRLGLAVLHSCGIGCTLEGSVDGSTWFGLGSGTGGPYSSVPLTGTARYVRLTTSSGFSLVRGLAVW
jgi:hypothetical protein